MKSRSIKILLLVICISLFPVASNAESNNCGDIFKDLCDRFFNESGDIIAIDKNGVDVSDSFKEEYLTLYHDKDYDSIHDAFVEELSFFKSQNVDVRQKSNARILMTYTTTQEFYQINYLNNHFPGDPVGVFFTITGEYVVSDGASEIVEARTILNIHPDILGSLLSVSPCNISTQARVGSNRKSVTFSADFDVTVSMQDDFIGATLWSETVSGYGNSFTVNL